MFRPPTSPSRRTDSFWPIWFHRSSVTLTSSPLSPPSQISLSLAPESSVPFRSFLVHRFRASKKVQYLFTDNLDRVESHYGIFFPLLTMNEVRAAVREPVSSNPVYSLMSMKGNFDVFCLQTCPLPLSLSEEARGCFFPGNVVRS